MINVNKLKGKIVEKGMNIELLSEKIGLDKSTMYRKLNAKGETFTIKEAKSIISVLELNQDEANSIFFANIVA